VKTSKIFFENKIFNEFIQSIRRVAKKSVENIFKESI
jgi:hypothetical protein